MNRRTKLLTKPYSSSSPSSASSSLSSLSSLLSLSSLSSSRGSPDWWIASHPRAYLRCWVCQKERERRKTEMVTQYFAPNFPSKCFLWNKVLFRQLDGNIIFCKLGANITVEMCSCSNQVQKKKTNPNDFIWIQLIGCNLTFLNFCAFSVWFGLVSSCTGVESWLVVFCILDNYGVCLLHFE